MGERGALFLAFLCLFLINVRGETKNCPSVSGPTITFSFPPQCGGAGRCTSALTEAVCSSSGCAKKTFLRFELLSEASCDSCCRNCTCHGDPHCTSFSGQKDSWILCDARDSTCTHTKAVCTTLTDHAGNKCTWKAGKTKWDFGKNGSPCVPNTASPPASLLMYETKNKDFSANTFLGERGTITKLELKMSGNTYTFDSTCLTTSSYSNLLTGVAHSRVVAARGGKKVWIQHTATKIEVSFLCTRLKPSDPASPFRIDVENLYEPDSDRANDESTGFCSTGEIPKQKSSTLTACKNGRDADPVVMTEVLCSAATTNVAACQTTWCNLNSQSPEKCLLNIRLFGWLQTWCARNTLPNGDPVDCPKDQLCDRCMDQVTDFGFGEVWQEFAKPEATGCITYNNLLRMPSACSDGVFIEHFEGGKWNPKVFVPFGSELCSDVLFDSSKDTDKALFIYPLRFRKCAHNCNRNHCQPVGGMKLSYRYFEEGSL